MRTRVSVLTILLAVIMAIALLAPGAAQAVATEAGTTISNDATVDYEVGGVAQTQITSATINFTVDAKVDFTVTANTGATNTVTPGGASNVKYLTFDVFNNGNVGLDFSLATVYNGGNFNQPIVETVVDTDASNAYEDVNDSDTFIDELAPGATIKVFVVASNIAAGLTDGWLSNHTLTATAYFNGTAATLGGAAGNCDESIATDIDAAGDNNDGCNTMDWLLTDAGSDGDEADSDNFLVSTASLTITKTSALLSDPINGITNPIAIPGATISFTIQVDNGAGGAIATEITITDAMPANMTYTSDGITVINSNGAAGGTFALSNAQGGCPEVGDACGWYDGTDTVVVNGITLDAGERTQMIFNASID